MADRFSAIDCARIAVEMEKRGVDMYSRASRLSANEKARKLFAKLENDEREHSEFFMRMLDECEKKSEEYDSGETREYLSAVAGQIVFSQGLVGFGRDDGFDNPTRILKNAIDAERDSILFYEAMRDIANAQSLDEIISQEKAHLTELTQMLKEELK